MQLKKNVKKEQRQHQHTMTTPVIPLHHIHHHLIPLVPHHHHQDHHHPHQHRRSAINVVARATGHAREGVPSRVRNVEELKNKLATSVVVMAKVNFI